MESAIPFSLLVLLSSLSLASSQHVLPDHHFINCGSNDVVFFTGRTFTGDVKPTSFSVSGDHATAVNINPGTPPVYQTARVFKKKSCYQLKADQNDTVVMLRLHFSPFSSTNFNSSNSKFDVWVSGFYLLSNFSVQNEVIIKEFIIPIGSEASFTINFAPSKDSSFAFVNAIEAFTAPPTLFLNVTSPLKRIYTINVGGNVVDVEHDTLRRKWVPDDPFIVNGELGKSLTYGGDIWYKSSLTYGGDIRYKSSLANRSDAPDYVYETAKLLDVNSTGITDFSNITWNFGVDKNANYRVRAHFCDINSASLKDENDAFYFFINSNPKESISPAKTWKLAAAFHFDYLVNSGHSGYLNISISRISGNEQMAFLNGLEIMKLLNDLGPIEEIKQEVEKKKKKKKKEGVYIVVGCVVGGVAFGLVGFFVGLKYRKVKRVAGTRPESYATPFYAGDYSSMSFGNNHPSPTTNLNLGLRVLFADILQATKGFDPVLMIGKGGFGKVYKGTFPNGTKVAVKRGEIGHGQGRPEFVTEIKMLSRIRHRHLVSLIGYCDERSEMILVYEFMEKGTLQDHLYNLNEDQPKLSWKQRLDICISAAQGLNYLHKGANGGIIHRDVKSTNILLDQHYVAKVADFGISRLDNVDQNDISGIKGSFGYLDPEYIMCLKQTVKSDVYAFGVVMLEVLCARPALDNMLEEANLADWAVQRIKNGELESIVDPFIVDSINTNSLKKFSEIAERCLKDTGDERPSMIDVLWDLEYVLQLQQNVTVREAHEESTMNSSLQLRMSMLHRLPSQSKNDYEVNGSSISSFPSASQVFSNLKIDEAR